MSHRLPVAEPSQSARRWNGFVCPDCRHIFRVSRDHDGRGVVCPSCRRMLRLPTESDEVPPLVVHGVEAHHEDEEEVVGTGDVDHSGHVKKRRRSSHKKDQGFDETFAKKEELDPRFVRGLIGSVGLLGAILLGALLWPDGDSPEPEEGVVSPPVAVKDGSEAEEEDKLREEAERSTVPAPFVESELVPIFEKFLDAQTPDEMAKWVRHPEVTLPRMKKFYGDDFRAVGFSSVVWKNSPMRTGNSIRVTITDGDYSSQNIHAVDEDGWKVDWESWVGWSEMTWEELAEKRPTDAVMFRVVVSDVSYFNFSFSDESRWSSYRLSSMDSEHAIYGYVPRAGELDARLKSLEGIEKRLFTLKLRFPEGATSNSQVEIEEIVTDDWLVTDDL